MSKTDFVDYVVGDLLAGIRGVRARAMFGGYGVYKDDAIFGIIADDVLYFKVDDSNRASYEKAGSQPFTYTAKKKKKVVMSYWEVPADILEDRETLEEWVERSLRIHSKVKKLQKRKSR